MLFRLPAGTRIVWRHWPEGVAVYNTLSGQTHFLNEVSAAVLAAFERTPQDHPSLIQAVSTDLAVDIDDTLTDYVNAAASEFSKLGLIEPAR